MPSSDQSTPPSSTGIPSPPSGAGAADLATDSNDPQVLRELLDRARERLAFYESFDRIIGENIRRSGELMVETVALREQAQALAAQSAKDHAAFAATRQAERDRYRALIEQALGEVSTVRPVIDAIVTRFESVLTELDESIEAEDVVMNEASSTNVPTAPTPVEPSATSPDLDTESEEAPSPPDLEIDVEASAEEPTAEPGTETTGMIAVEAAPAPDVESGVTPQAPTTHGDRSIDVLAHGVPNARVAISLQKMLREMDVVSSVEAREFANGELRLAIQAKDSLPEIDLAAWLANNNGELMSVSASVMELTFGSA